MNLTPTVRKLIFAGTLTAIFVLALWMRFHGIDARPMHSDEAVQAYRVGSMLAGETFVYNPQDFHGPTLYFFTLWLCKILGIGSFAELTETLVRAVPAVIGALGCVLIPLSFFGKRTSLVAFAGTLLALSNIAVFYSAYFIQETILVVSAWVAAGIWFFREKTLPNALLAGLCAGLAIASKETWILMAAAFVIGGAGIARVRIRFRKTEKTEKLFAKRLVLATLSAGIVSAFFYASFGQNPGGLADFFGAFKNYFFAGSDAESPHAKAFFYYAGLICENDRLPLLVVFLSGTAFLLRTFFPTSQERRFQCAFRAGDFAKPVFLLVAGGALFILYSIIPYKTPWCVSGMLPAIALLPSALIESRVLRTVYGYEERLERTIAGFFLWGVCLIPFSGKSYTLAYEQSDETLPEIVPAIEKSKADFVGNGGSAETFFVALVGPEYWPLPWYLRKERFGVWETIEAVPAQAPVIIADVEAWAEADASAAEIKKSRTISCAGLRPNVVIEARENFSSKLSD